tara:strand:- start:175 stop:2025 length:1851 start_codon:yes stop_codon:yes gene_type:complete
MNTGLKNKIEATDTSIKSLLKDQKFYIDYFQRDYRWKEKHIKLLIEDLTTTFLKSYSPDDKRSAIATYQNYYLGPVVFSKDPETGKKSIIDGQQRITSITLLLIYLNHLQSKIGQSVSISELIFSEKYGEKSFNMTDKMREPCLKSLFEDGSYDPTAQDEETIINMVERYEDIVQSFPEEICHEALPYFIDWFTENVVIVEINAYSDENAYTIFETMNDRGLNLTPTEMLKGYVLSKVASAERRNEINELWKQQLQKLHHFGENVDQTFFQSWFRGKYAKSIRPGKAGSENQDFELIGSRFHNWFKDNHAELFELHDSDDFYEFFKNEFPFFVSRYINNIKGMDSYSDTLRHLHYIKHWGIAESLQDPLLLSVINYGDSTEVTDKKTDLVARYIETFTTLRSVNFKKFGQTSIKYTMFNVMKAIRGSDLESLGSKITQEVNSIDLSWSAVQSFGLHGQNKKFIKHLLSRITGHLDHIVGKQGSYTDYKAPNGKQFEIEHIWGNKFEQHMDEFEQKGDFQRWRNSIGALILLPNGTNQSFSSNQYAEKLEHYIKENTYAQTLHPIYYEKNPNFLKPNKLNVLGFKPHLHFKKQDIQERCELVQRLCQQIWCSSYFEA